ncbi:MAG TPA: PIN domain-containing protein [Gemmatimonadaceae bacterium]|nr:PIN domain-containing protein [Gemmatimonadaceae bacterium]
MAFCVVYDACVLYPAMLRDLLLRIAVEGIVRARWSDEILDECFEAIARDRPDLAPTALARTRRLMNEAVPDCLVTEHQSLMPGLLLPDPDDRHVLAAAIRAGAQAIVTFNVADFPTERLAAFGMEAKHPDDFVVETIDLAPAAMGRIIESQHLALTHPPVSRAEILDSLERAGLVQAAVRLRSLDSP